MLQYNYKSKEKYNTNWRGDIEMKDEINKKQEKRQITMRVDKEVVEYFKELSKDSGIPYQTLINMCLLDCARNKKSFHISWE